MIRYRSMRRCGRAATVKAPEDRPLLVVPVQLVLALMLLPVAVLILLLVGIYVFIEFTTLRLGLIARSDFVPDRWPVAEGTRVAV